MGKLSVASVGLGYRAAVLCLKVVCLGIMENVQGRTGFVNEDMTCLLVFGDG